MTGETVVNLQNSAINLIMPKATVRSNHKDSSKADDVSASAEKSEFAEVLSEKNADAEKVESKSEDVVKAENTEKSEVKTEETEKNSLEELEGNAEMYVMLNNYVNAEPMDVQTDVDVVSEVTSVAVEGEIKAVEAVNTVGEIVGIDTAVISEKDTAVVEEVISQTENVTVETTEVAMQQTQLNENEEAFVRFVDDMNVNRKDIVSVKYTAYNIANIPENEQAKNNVESILQKLFPQEEATAPAEEDVVQTAVTEAKATVEAVQATVVPIAVTEQKNVEVSVEPVVVDGEVTEVTEIKVETSQVTTEMSDTADANSEMFADDGHTEDFSSLLEQNNNNKLIGNNFGTNNAVQFRLFDIDTSRSTTQQVGNMLMNMLADRALLENNQDMKQMVIQLNPETLGKIMIKIQAVGEEMSVKIVSTNSEVRDMISSQMVQISNAIKEQGINLTSAEVAHSPFDNADNGQQQSGSQQQNGDNSREAEKNERSEFFSFTEQFEKLADSLLGRS